jgi:hypothetical protein
LFIAYHFLKETGYTSTVTVILVFDVAALLLLEEEGEKPPYDDPLRRTRVPFGGLVNDVKRRFPHYKSDITEGLNLQCLAAAIYVLCSSLWSHHIWWSYG